MRCGKILYSRQVKDDNISPMRIACWIPKAKNKHTQNT